ncbi:MAG: hypothetical protein WKG01_25675 [Kofleriaceae bacterium]
MSRFTASLVLVVSLFTSLASADTHFAAPPPTVAVAPESADLRVSPPLVSRGQVRRALIANRAHNLARFRAYYRAGSYPSNVYADGLTNVWRDEDGRLCAAATLMAASGQRVLVESIAEQNNFIRLADVTQGPILDWILTSGLTQSELVAIQKPFNRVGTIGPVTSDTSDPSQTEAKIDPAKRTKETRRLVALYRKVDAALVRNAQHNLDLAVTQLMKRPDLAAAIVGP